MSESAATFDALDLGAVLLRTTRLEPEQLEQARERQLESRESLSDILIEEGMLNADEVRRALAEQLDLKLIGELPSEEIDEAIALHVPIGFAKQHTLIAVGRAQDESIRIVAANPLATAPLDDLQLLFDSSEIHLELAAESVICSL